MSNRLKGEGMASDASAMSSGASTSSGKSRGLSARFARLASRTATIAGNYLTFMLMLAIVLLWAISGPLFKFSTTWQLVINTGTTIVTFLMVFLIQNTQNRDSLAMHLKLDEIIRAISDADDELMNAEDESDEKLAELKTQYQHLLDEHHGLKESVSGRTNGAHDAQSDRD
jgi:low affinity Fe/Cu permease